MGRTRKGSVRRSSPALGPRADLVLGLALLVALAAAPTADARTQGDVTSLDPHGAHEVNVRLDEGWTLAYNWSVREDGVGVYFDVHTHDGQRVEYLRRMSSADRANGTVTADQRGVHSLYWQTRDRAATVGWRIEGDFLTMEEHFPDDEGGPLPGPAAGLAAVGLAGAAALWTVRRRS